MFQIKESCNFIKDVMESLILAQDERWRHALHMQVERGLVSLLIDLSGGRVSNA